MHPKLEKVLGRLSAPRRRGNGYAARCPAHDDRVASLEVAAGRDGIVFCCHAGCPTNTVREELGLTWGDLFWSAADRPDSLSSEWSAVPIGSANPPWPPKSKKVHSTPEKAALCYRMGHPHRTWVYTTAEGAEVGRVLRWNRYQAKDVRTLARVPDGWITAHPPAPRVIYRLPEVLGNPNARVWLCEGEKCADWVTSLGLLGTCTWGGCNGARHADLSPLSGRRVVIVPDHDMPGIKYAQECVRLLAPIVASLEVVPPVCFPWGDDIADLETEAAIAALGLASNDLSLIGLHDESDRGSSPNDSQEGEPC